jgi:hypothetical protein
MTGTKMDLRNESNDNNLADTIAKGLCVGKNEQDDQGKGVWKPTV